MPIKTKIAISKSKFRTVVKHWGVDTAAKYFGMPYSTASYFRRKLRIGRPGRSNRKNSYILVA